VDAAGLVVAMTADGRAIGPVSVRMDSDLRVVVSELLRLAVPWLPCVDGEGRLRGVVSQAAISRQVRGASVAASSEAVSKQGGGNAATP